MIATATPYTVIRSQLGTRPHESIDTPTTPPVPTNLYRILVEALDSLIDLPRPRRGQQEHRPDLGTNPTTVSNHIGHAYPSSSMTTRAEATMRALQHGVVRQAVSP